MAKSDLRAAIDDLKAPYLRALDELDLDAVEAFAAAVLATRERGGVVYVCGNGGSASTASHLATDLMKTAAVPGIPPVRAIALGDNPALLTAWANDTSYDRIFAEPLAAMATADDLLVVVSASGNSPNILEALVAAKQLGVESVALTGFDGGVARSTADHCVHVPVDDYGVVEVAHSAVGHLVAFGIRNMLRSSGSAD